MNKKTNKVKIDTHGSILTSHWQVFLDDTEITKFVKNIKLEAQAGEVPTIWIQVLARSLELPSVLKGCVQQSTYHPEPPTELPKVPGVFEKSKNIKQYYPIKYIHARCGGVAFYCTHRMVSGETVASKDFIYENGKAPESGTEILCGYCRERIYSMNDKHLIPMSY